MASWISKLKTKLSNFPRGQEQIWWLIEHQKWWPIQLLAPLGFWAGFLLLFHISLVPIGAAIFATAVIVHIFLHELGHLAVYETMAPSRILWLFPIGAVAAPMSREEDKRIDATITYWTAAWLGQAGVLVNIAPLVILGLVMFLKSGSAYTFACGAGLMFGAVIVTFNLIPFWQTDGNLVFRTIMISLGEKRGKVLVWTVIGIAITIILVTILIHPMAGFTGLYNKPVARLTGWVSLPAILAASVWQSWKTNSKKVMTNKPMTSLQAILHFTLHLEMFLFAIFVLFGFP